MKSFKKITILLMLFTVLLFGCKSTVLSEGDCTVQAAKQMAKVLYKEVGAKLNSNPTEDAFAKFVTAGVILNNSYRRTGSTEYERLMNMTDGQYSHYSSYRDKSFEEVVDPSLQSKMLYISELILSGKYTIPKEITLQASESIVNKYGNIWAVVDTIYMDVYFGWEKGKTLSNKDIYGNTLPSTEASYYKELAGKLINTDYSKVNTSNVCNGVVDTSGIIADSFSTTPGSKKAKKKVTPKAARIADTRPLCEQPGPLKAIRIVKLVIQILTILAPAVIVIVSGKQLFLAVVNDGDVKACVKSLIIKVFIGAFIVFLPNIILTITDEVIKMTGNKIDVRACVNNANEAKIAEAEANTPKNT